MNNTVTLSLEDYDRLKQQASRRREDVDKDIEQCIDEMRDYANYVSITRKMYTNSEVAIIVSMYAEKIARLSEYKKKEAKK